MSLTWADLLYLFCTFTGAFYRFQPIEPIEFSKSFENLKIVADRLPPPPPINVFYGDDLAMSLSPVSTISPRRVSEIGESKRLIAPSIAAGLRCT